jgi:hypothetical protein
MTRRPHGWRVGLLALVGMLMMLIAPAMPVAAQGDPATDFNTTMSQLSSMTPVAGPLSGSIDAANAETVPAGVSVTNGAAHAEFVVPAVNAGTLWAIAMEFRVSDAGKNFLLVFPDGTWQLDNGVQKAPAPRSTRRPAQLLPSMSSSTALVDRSASTVSSFPRSIFRPCRVRAM